MKTCHYVSAMESKGLSNFLWEKKLGPFVISG